jgi:hypothetical protein
MRAAERASSTPVRLFRSAVMPSCELRAPSHELELAEPLFVISVLATLGFRERTGPVATAGRRAGFLPVR